MSPTAAPVFRTLRADRCIHLRAMAIVVLRVGDELDDGDIVPGFRCRLADIFTP
jgi:hypothetical protein